MFTGLIQDVGSIESVERTGDQLRLKVATGLAGDDLQLGESIAVNGMCLTATDFGKGWFRADVSPETVARTNFSELAQGVRVNLERALRLCDRLGGHLVSGHVDGVGKITKKIKDRNAVRFSIQHDPELSRFVVEKGSIAIDGISLTVNAVGQDFFEVAIIPHSLEQTNLQWRGVGQRVNLETDLIGKYVARLLQGGAQPSDRGGLSLEFLAKHGFL